jgi:hypothetical protein
LGGSLKGSEEFGKDELIPLTSLETKVQSLREVVWCKKDVHQNIIPFDTNLWFLKDMNSRPMHLKQKLQIVTVRLYTIF